MALPANAQIYSWRDADGKLIVSNVRQPGTTEIRSYAVPRATSVRATRPAPAGRGREYDALIDEHSRTHSVRPDLVRAVMQVESGFNPMAMSPKGAMGLMQLMPATAREFGVRNPFNPIENVRAGVAYLRSLLDRYQNREELALAAYNAGPGAVDKYRQTVPPYRETRDYVAHINRMVGPGVIQPGSTSTPVRDNKIYKIIETIGGREVVRYTDKRPTTPLYEVVTHQ